MELSMNKQKRRANIQKQLPRVLRQIEHLGNSIKDTIDFKFALESELAEINRLEGILRDPNTTGYDSNTGVFTVSGGVGISEPVTNLLTTAYPNPFNDKITIKYPK